MIYPGCLGWWKNVKSTSSAPQVESSWGSHILPEIQGFSLCWSLPSLWVTLKYAAYHKHSCTPMLFSYYIFLFNFWNRFSLVYAGSHWHNQGSEPLRWEVCQGRACGSKLLSVYRILLQFQREFTWEPEIVSLLRLTLCGILLVVFNIACM